MTELTDTKLATTIEMTWAETAAKPALGKKTS
jgi:hypothetical protein